MSPVGFFRQGVGRWLAGGLIVAAGLLLGFVIGRGMLSIPASPESTPTVDTPTPRATAAAQIGPYAGEIAPDFRLPALAGGVTSLRDHRGHRVLVNFLTTWCEPCRDEMPGLEAQAEKHAVHDWVVLGVDIMENREAVDAFQDEFKLTFPLLLDERGEVARQYLVTGTPTSLFIDREGLVVERQLGYMSETEIAGIIERMP